MSLVLFNLERFFSFSLYFMTLAFFEECRLVSAQTDLQFLECGVDAGKTGGLLTQCSLLPHPCSDEVVSCVTLTAAHP